MTTYIIIGIVILIVLTLLISIMYRTVVSTNEAHIVQTKKRAIPYGKDYEAGNVYYNWPSWFPVIGVTRATLTVSNFTISLEDYQAYDNGKVPFSVDVKAFFRVADAAKAAQRVSTESELRLQLTDILKGAVRQILASKDIEEIMEGRSELGGIFTEEVASQLSEWGVANVKNIKLMDIKDGHSSNVISDIQAKKQAIIEKEKRIVEATATKEAEIAEIEAKRDSDLKDQDAKKLVGERTAETTKMIGVADEQAKQEIAEQAKTTAEKNMTVKKVEMVRQSEIDKDVAMVKAEEQKQTDIIKAQGEKQQTITIAEGHLSEKEKEAAGIQAVGLANAEAEKAMLLAPVTAQITLADKIAELPEYIQYLLGVKSLEVEEVVGSAKAKALESGDLKVISNVGTPNDGVNSLMDLFSSKGGASLASMLENLKQTEGGQALVQKLLGENSNPQKVEKSNKDSKKVEKADKDTKKVEKESNVIKKSNTDIDDKIKSYLKG